MVESENEIGITLSFIVFGVDPHTRFFNLICNKQSFARYLAPGGGLTRKIFKFQGGGVNS